MHAERDDYFFNACLDVVAKLPTMHFEIVVIKSFKDIFMNVKSNQINQNSGKILNEKRPKGSSQLFTVKKHFVF